MVDKDSILPTHTPHAQPSSDALATSSFVFNLTVTLKDSKPKIAGAPSKSRKEEQAKALADKAVSRMLLYCPFSFFHLFLFDSFASFSFLSYLPIFAAPFFLPISTSSSFIFSCLLFQSIECR